LFLNALPLRADVDDRTWAELIGDTDARLAHYYGLRHYPVGAIQRDVGLDFSASAFNYTNFHVYKDASAGTELDVGGGFDETNYRVLVNVRKNEKDASHVFLINAEPTVFDAPMRTRMAGYVADIIAQVLESPFAKIDKRALLRPEQNNLNGAPSSAGHADQCVHEWIARLARENPDATALIHDGRRISMAELDRAAERLAHVLRARGIGPESRVGVCLPRSVDLIVSILGVLKAGGCYVPIDADYPESRRNYVIDKSGAALVLTSTRLLVLPCSRRSRALDLRATSRLPNSRSREYSKTPRWRV
jgi:non-ribosomal peptide synthetase component F